MHLGRNLPILYTGTIIETEGDTISGFVFLYTTQNNLRKDTMNPATGNNLNLIKTVIIFVFLLINGQVKISPNVTAWHKFENSL